MPAAGLAVAARAAPSTGCRTSTRTCTLRRVAGSIEYRSDRTVPAGARAEHAGTDPTGPARPNRSQATLEHFLTERYSLYAVDECHDRPPRRHPPPALAAAARREPRSTATPWPRPYGIRLEGEPLLHYAAREDVVIWPLRPEPGRG